MDKIIYDKYNKTLKKPIQISINVIKNQNDIKKLLLNEKNATSKAIKDFVK